MKTLIPAILLFFIVIQINLGNCSVGDYSPIYQNCLRKCVNRNCDLDEVEFTESSKQPFYLKLLQWTCKDECQYQCMWVTVDGFKEKGWKTPQFHGKWPFLRFLGIQEPASVLFSFFNLAAHIMGIRKFRKEVPSDAPLYWLWHFFCAVCLNAWIWSMVFHTRDKPLTELLDYAFAFSIVLVSCYCMIVRIVRGLMPKFFIIVVSTFFLSCFINHVLYLSVGYFDYAYNMKVNVSTGTLTAIGWFVWATYNRLRLPYAWKCALYVTLTGVATLLELLDSPPILWILDWHALWHLSTAPLTVLFYSFIIDDCKYLKKRAEVEIKIVSRKAV